MRLGYAHDLGVCDWGMCLGYESAYGDCVWCMCVWGTGLRVCVWGTDYGIMCLQGVYVVDGYVLGGTSDDFNYKI